MWIALVAVNVAKVEFSLSGLSTINMKGQNVVLYQCRDMAGAKSEAIMWPEDTLEIKKFD